MSDPTFTTTAEGRSEQRRLACQVTLPDGSTQRWGPDEPDARRIVESTSLNTEMPGGFGPATITLGRTSSYDPLPALYSMVRTYDAGSNETLHEGRIVAVPQSSTTTVDVALEGYAKALEDDATARVIFYDRDLSAWQSASAQRQLNLLSGTVTYADPSAGVWDFTTGSPGVSTAMNDPWAAAGGSMSEAWYNAEGLGINAVDYAWRKNSNVNSGLAQWAWVCSLTADDIGSSALDTANLRAAGPGSGTLTSAGAATYKFARVYAWYNAALASNVGTYEVMWTLLGVIGNHGLTLQGAVGAPNTGRGLLVSDMLAYAVGRWCPQLTFTTGAGGSIETSAFIVPHAVFKESTTASSIVQALVLFGGSSNYPLDWGVYEGRQFFARTPGTYGKVWRVRRDQAAEDPSDGPDVTTLLNGVQVSYDDGTGTKHTIGPVGSASDVETAVLADTTANNPANNDGARHWSTFDAGITSQAGAQLIGQLILANANRMPWRGSVSVKGDALETGGQVHSPGYMRAGDQIVVEDDPDTRPRFINSTSFDGVTASCSIGAPPDKLETILAKAGVELVGRL